MVLMTCSNPGSLRWFAVWLQSGCHLDAVDGLVQNPRGYHGSPSSWHHTEATHLDFEQGIYVIPMWVGTKLLAHGHKLMKYFIVGLTESLGKEPLPGRGNSSSW
jgi:hypothetical protein